MTLIPVEKSDLKIDQPVPWDIYDQQNKLLLKHNHIFKTSEELEELTQTPIFRSQTTAPKKIEMVEEKKPEYCFNDMKLKVGDKLQLQPLSSLNQTAKKTNDSFYQVNLIGYIQERTLLVTVPKKGPPVNQLLLEGEQVIIRLFNGKCAFSFTVFIDKIIKLPFEYLHLSFPKTISGQAIRKARRIKCSFPATTQNKSNPIIITNISSTGAEINTTSNLGKPGEYIALAFSVNIYGKEVPLAIRSIIKSSKQTNKNMFSYGIEFSKLQPEQVLILHNLIDQVLADDPRQSA